MGEDQDADRAGGFDETGGGDRLPRRRRMPEPVTADGARVALRRDRRPCRVPRARARRARCPRSRHSRRSRPPPRRTRPPPRRRPPQAGAARPRSARSTSRRARPPGDGAARFRTSGAAASRSGPARVRASARSGSSIRATAPVAPASSSDRASSSARRRAVPGVSTWPGSSSGWRNGSPAHTAARSAAATERACRLRSSQDLSGGFLHRGSNVRCGRSQKAPDTPVGVTPRSIAGRAGRGQPRRSEPRYLPDGRLGSAVRARDPALPGRGGAARRARRRAAAAVDTDGKRRLGGRALPADARRRCPSVARARGRALARELRRRSCRELGAADRRDEGARAGRRRARGRGGSPWALAEGAGESESPIGRYAAALACSVLGDWEHARIHADAIRIRDDFPRDVGDALAMIAAEDVVGYIQAVESVLESFERREDYLEDVPRRRHRARAAGIRSEAQHGRGSDV